MGFQPVLTVQVKKFFFVRKSLKVSFLRVDNDVIVWLIVRYKNETFLILLQEVSLKSHRSIINYPFGEFMSRKAGIVVEKCLLFQLNKVHRLVSWCPLHGHLETMYWASREHVLGTGCPHHGHRVPNVWDCFWALWFNDFGWPLFILFIRRVDSVNTYFIKRVD